MTRPSSNTKKTKKTAPKRAAPLVTPTIRLDAAVAKHAAISRERAQALILAGDVKVNGVTERKAALGVGEDARIDVGAQERFVSRGGYKLEHALKAFGWSVQGLRCLDVGASTGGFTDCLLQRGASSVTAVDVGYGHLAWALRQNSKVRVVERTNFRHADLDALGASFDFVCADVSFISLAKLAEQFFCALSEGGSLIALIKPQFEVGRAFVERGGVVRDPHKHADAIRAVIAAFEASDLHCSKLTYSPIKGPAGNIEFLLGATPNALGTRCSGRSYSTEQITNVDIEGVVRAAHETLDR